MKPILEINSISKKFRIQHEQRPYETFQETLIRLMLFRKSGSTEEFWALKDISFHVDEGESIGIIGKNGAGKSTLLKILSRITPPTSGKVVARGRIASLLEVGTGFHPELTGRENIYLNGSILGMRRREIQSKFDSMVEFAGIEKFLDTPLKHFSSGMQLRLAFAVAAFLEPEVLIIDEVLAVGDAEFQQKCIGKMERVTESGRTILFVSHQMGLVTQLCSRVILLSDGKILQEGKTGDVVEQYLSLNLHEQENKFKADETLSKDKPMYIFEAFTLTENNLPVSVFGYFDPVCLSIKVRVRKPEKNALLSVALLDKFGNRVFTLLRPLEELHRDLEIYSGKLRIPPQIIAPNSYSFHFALAKSDGTIYDIHEGQCRISITDTGSPFAMYEGKNYGSIILKCDWI